MGADRIGIDIPPPKMRAIGNAERGATCTYRFGPIDVWIRQTEGVWELTPHGQTLGEAMAAFPETWRGRTVFEIGAGTGVHAIAAIKLGAEAIDVTDIEPAALVSCQENAALNDVSLRHVWLRDWMRFSPRQRYDVVLCNPPFCKAGTSDRRYFIRELIRCSPRLLRSRGRLIFVQSSMADFPASERELERAGFSFSPLLEKRHAFRPYYFSEPGFIEESRRVRNGFDIVDGTYVETLRVYDCALA